MALHSVTSTLIGFSILSLSLFGTLSLEADDCEAECTLGSAACGQERVCARFQCPPSFEGGTGFTFSCISDPWRPPISFEDELPPEEAKFEPGDGSGGGGGGGGGGFSPTRSEVDDPFSEAKVLSGAFAGELGHRFLPLNQGRAEALFTDLPELEGTLAVRGLEGTSMCYHLEVTNNQPADAFFFVSFSMPTLIEAADAYQLEAVLYSEFVDASSDGTVTVQDLEQTIEGITADNIVSFIGSISGTDILPGSGTIEAGELSFFQRPAAGPAPANGPFAMVRVFTSLTLSPGDMVILQGGALVDEGGGADRCSFPALRLDPNIVFFDDFRSGDTSAWTLTIPTVE